MALRKVQVIEKSGRVWVAEKDVPNDTEFQAWISRLSSIYKGASFQPVGAGASAQAVSRPEDDQPLVGTPPPPQPSSDLEARVLESARANPTSKPNKQFLDAVYLAYHGRVAT